MELYRYIPVWRRQEGGAKLYRCFEVLSLGKFVVQSVDHFHPGSAREHRLQLEDQFLELLLEQGPAERATAMPSIEEAIQCFEAAFNDSTD